ncbi:MAG: hypothetical protein ACYS3N_14705 [Planctomycetota bacterium]|jgi:hypothetical protein
MPGAKQLTKKQLAVIEDLFAGARYAPVAAAKLIQLTESDKPETARKACLDIISMPILTANRKAQPSGEPQPADTQFPVSFNPETAGKLLAVLAEEKTIKKL